MTRITWNYSVNDQGETLHLIRLINGLGILRTTKELKMMGVL